MNALTSRPVATAQSLTVPSELPAASQCPSGLNATLLTRSVKPVSVRTSRPVNTSQS